MSYDKPDVDEEKYNLTAGEKLVLYVLEQNQEMTTQEIMEEARLSRSCCSRALTTLMERDMAYKTRDPVNGNKVVYGSGQDRAGSVDPIEYYAEVNGGSGYE